MNPRANKFLAVPCPCGAEIGQPCRDTATGEAMIGCDYARTVLFFDGQEYLAKLQAEEAKLAAAAKP